MVLRILLHNLVSPNSRIFKFYQKNPCSTNRVREPKNSKKHPKSAKLLPPGVLECPCLSYLNHLGALEHLVREFKECLSVVGHLSANLST